MFTGPAGDDFTFFGQVPLNAKSGLVLDAKDKKVNEDARLVLSKNFTHNESGLIRDTFVKISPGWVRYRFDVNLETAGCPAL